MAQFLSPQRLLVAGFCTSLAAILIASAAWIWKTRNSWSLTRSSCMALGPLHLPLEGHRVGLLFPEPGNNNPGGVGGLLFTHLANNNAPHSVEGWGMGRGGNNNGEGSSWEQQQGGETTIGGLLFSKSGSNSIEGMASNALSSHSGRCLQQEMTRHRSAPCARM